MSGTPPPKKPYKSEESNLHSNHRQRMYDRFAADMSLENFAPHEILEMLLFRGVPAGNTSGTAHRLLEKYGSILRVLQAPPAELAAVKGMTGRAALDLSVLYHAMKVIPALDMGEHPVINSTDKAVAYVRNRLAFETYELAYIICLDGRFRVINVNRRTEYLPQTTTLNARTILKKAVSCDASKVILVHNHPGGDPSPSADDNLITRDAALALAAADIPLLDHVIVAGDAYYSYNKEQYIQRQLQNAGRYESVAGQLADYSSAPMLNKLLSNKDL